MKDCSADPVIAQAWKSYPVRIPGDLKCTNCGADAPLVQYNTNGWVSHKCVKCGSTPWVVGQEFIDLDLWVACPGCKKRMAPGYLVPRGIYGYRCEKCGLEIPLAALVPDENDIAEGPPASVSEGRLARTRETVERLLQSPKVADGWKSYPLRLRSSHRCTNCGTHTFLAQSNKRKRMTRYCPKCGRLKSLTMQDLVSLELWVVCPVCNSHMEPGYLAPRREQGYQCKRCSMKIPLSLLLPNTRDVRES